MEWRFLVPVTGVLFAGIGVGLYVLGDGLVRLISGRLFRRRGDERRGLPYRPLRPGSPAPSRGSAIWTTWRQQDASLRITP